MRHLTKYILRTLLLLIFFSISAGVIRAGKWKYHPAFDNLPVRIVDTERYTYFQVLQKYYQNNLNTYDHPITALLVYDKRDRNKGFLPLSELRDLSGEDVRFCEYNPEGGYLVILYLDGTIDVSNDSGSVVTNTYLKDNSRPGLSMVNSMTLGGDEIWVATHTGCLAVDARTGKTIIFVPTDVAISNISRCGDRIVAFADGKIYVYEGDRNPRRFSDFKEIAIPGSQPNAKMLMPRADGSFYYVGNRKNTGNYSVNIAWHADTGWKSRFLSDINTYLPAVTGRITNEFERTFIRNKEGWCITGDTYICQLYKDRDVATGTLFEAVATLKADASSERRPVSVAGTWDGSTCWTYADRGRVVEGERTELGYIIDDSRAMRPNLPAVSHTNNLEYVPGFGTAVVHHGYSWIFTQLGNYMPPLLSVFRDGEWHLPNPAYNLPRSAEKDPTLRNLYNSYFNRFPVTDPTGLASDPLNRDYVWMGSTYSGIAALNIRDPKSDPIHLGSDADPLRSYPGFIDIFPDVTSWRGFDGVSAPSFDSNGNLWAIYLYFDGVKEGVETMRLMVWPASNREKILNSGDVSLADGILFFDLPSGNCRTSTMKTLALKNNRQINDAVFGYIFGSPERRLVRYRHGGTLSDKSDDKVDIIYKIRDQHGALWNIEYGYSMTEDSDGMVWLGESNTLLYFDPSSEVRDNIIDGRVLDLKSGDCQGNPFNSIPIYGVVREPGGRLWVATAGLGLYCISPDLSSLEGHYTMSNSGLRSDVCYGIAWNPDTRSLMISTDAGLCELWPDGSSGVAKSKVSVYPREITSGYEGKVTIRGLMPRSSVAVIGRDGETLKTLATDTDGFIMWDLTDDSGNRVKNGFYILRGDFGDEEIVVMK